MDAIIGFLPFVFLSHHLLFFSLSTIAMQLSLVFTFAPRSALAQLTDETVTHIYRASDAARSST